VTNENGFLQVVLINEVFDIVCHGNVIVFGHMLRVSMISEIQNKDPTIQVTRQDLTNRPIILHRSKKPMQKQDRMVPLSSMMSGRNIVSVASYTVDQLVRKFDSEGFGSRKETARGNTAQNLGWQWW